MKTTKQELGKGIKETIIKCKEIIFGIDSLLCIKCLDELRKQQVIDEKAYDQKLMDGIVRKLAWDRLQKNIAIDGVMMIGIRTGKVLGPEVNYTRS